MSNPKAYLAKNTGWFLLGMLPPAAILLSYLALGQDAHFAVHDNLDAEPVIRDMLAADLRHSPGDGQVQQVMNGIPRACLPSDLNVATWVHYLLPSFGAFVTNLSLVLLVAYVGTWLLLRRRLIPDAPAWMAAAVAACFASLPVFPEYGISVAGQPMLLLALLWVHDRKHRWAALGMISLFVLWSSLYLVGFFVLGVAGLLFVAVSIQKRRIHFPLMFALMGMAAGYLIVEHKLLLESFVHKSFTPHRVEFVSPPPISFRNGIGSAITFFRQGFYHAPPLNAWMMFPLFAMAGWGMLLWLRRRADGHWKALALIAMSIAAASAFLGFTHWTPIENLFASVDFFRQFNRERIFFLLPLGWYLLLALACALAWKSRLLKWGAPFLLALQACYILAHHVDFGTNLRRLQHGPDKPIALREETLSPRSYFCEPLMEKAEKAIGRDMASYRVASIGIPPAVSEHHGFFTLDFYNNFYRLDYKHQFRRIMAAELAKSETNRKYFDEWGNKCILLPAETGDTLRHLALDMAAFREMGGEYLLSDPVIGNADSLGLRLLGAWQQPDSFAFRVHLYGFK